MLVLITSIATAEYWCEEEDPAVFVSNPNGAIVWSIPEIGSNQFEVLPYSACIYNSYPYSDDFVGYDYGGDSGYISWKDLSYFPDGENNWPPLYVVNCNEWISAWSEPEIGSSRLRTLPLGTEITTWTLYSAEFIWLYDENGGWPGFVLWDYLAYNR